MSDISELVLGLFDPLCLGLGSNC